MRPDESSTASAGGQENPSPALTGRVSWHPLYAGDDGEGQPPAASAATWSPATYPYPVPACQRPQGDDPPGSYEDPDALGYAGTGYETSQEESTAPSYRAHAQGPGSVDTGGLQHFGPQNLLLDVSSQSDVQGPVPFARVRKARAMGAAGSAKVGTQTWLKIDRLGITTLVTTDKHRVAMKLGVQPRDLRLLDPQMASVSPPAILDRERAIVINIGSIKCIITLEYVLVVNPEDAVGAQLAEVLKEKLSNPMHVGKVMSYPGLSRITSIARNLHGVPGAPAAPPPVVYGLSFELKVLEICLDMVVDALEMEAGELERLIIPTLEDLTRKVKVQALEIMRRGKNRLTRLVTRIETIKEVLEKFLEDDEDMHKLNLTAQEATRHASMFGTAAGPLGARDFGGPAHSRASKRSSRTGTSGSGGSRSTSSTSSSGSSSSGSSLDFEDEAEVAEVEMLLEAYQMHLSTLFNKLQTLEEFVQDTEHLVNTSLDTHQNRIISVDILLTAFATTLSISTAISGLFGVNMEFHTWVPDTHRSFVLISTVAAVGVPFALLVAFVFWAFQQRLVTFGHYRGAGVQAPSPRAPPATAPVSTKLGRK